jgi:hypothetical protein
MGGVHGLSPDEVAARAEQEEAAHVA